MLNFRGLTGNLTRVEVGVPPIGLLHFLFFFLAAVNAR